MSPGVLTLELLILSGKVQPKLRAWLYLTGAVFVLVAFSFLALTVLRNVSEATGGPPEPLVDRRQVRRSRSACWSSGCGSCTRRRRWAKSTSPG